MLHATDANTRAIAQAFVEARRSGRAIADYPGVAPPDLTAAYAIQDAALSLSDREVGGWKVGRIGEPLASRLAADRLVGPIFAETIVRASHEPTRMPVFADGFAAAEAEFMLRLAPPAGGTIPKTNAEAMEWVDEVRIGIEIASSPYPGINRDGPCVTVSDHGNNAGLVLGRTVGRAFWADLAAIAVSLDIDGETMGEATVATMLDGPFGAVRFLLDNLHRRGIVVQAGWWVSTGAITGVHEIAAASTTVARFDGVGEVAALIV